MADNLYSESLTEVLNEKIPDLANAADDNAVKKVISEVKKEAAERTPPAYVADKWIYRGTVAVLGLAVLFVAFAQYQIVIADFDPVREIPDGLIAIGSAAIGALAGLLAPTPAR